MSLTAIFDPIVLDTNVIVSAAIFRSEVPAQAVAKAFQNYTVISSFETRTELREVFRRPRFERYMPLHERIDALEEFIEEMVLHTPTDIVTTCRDPRDNKFLELAVFGRAKFLVTGDNDLLALHPFGKLEIITPAMFLRDI